MQADKVKNKSHNCLLSSLESTRASFSLNERISKLYFEKLQDFCQWLFHHGWKTTSLIIPSLCGEPIETTASAFRMLVGWKSTWERYGFYDAGNPDSLDKLKKNLSATPNKCNPVLLLHGVFSSPDIWLPWAPKLQKAQEKKRIGPVITLQLPNDMEERMQVVHKAIKDIVDIYRACDQEIQIDIVGHSKGGFAGHLASFKEITVKDSKGIERRWHGQERNPLVRKVVSIAAPTWLCCYGQNDETSKHLIVQDIYPKKVFTDKNVESAYTAEQIDVIQKLHPHIYDIIPAQDAISSIISPLDERQITVVKHGHLGAVTCSKVCKLAVKILSSTI